MQRHLVDGQQMVAAEYYAVGVGGALAGRGADLCIIDDPVSEQDALSPTALDSIYEWYIWTKTKIATWRLYHYSDDTRWGIKDLTARVLQKQAQGGADKWEVVEFPAIFPETGNVLMARILEQRRVRRRESINTRRQNGTHNICKTLQPKRVR